MMLHNKRKAQPVVGTKVGLDKSSTIQANYTKDDLSGKRFRVQITELEDVSGDASMSLIHALNGADVTDINYLPFNGLRAS